MIWISVKVLSTSGVLKIVCIEKFLAAKRKELNLSSCLVKTGTDISLQAVSALCYEFIMHIRLDAYRDTHTKMWLE